MIKFVADTNMVAERVALIEKACEKKASIPVLGCVLMRTYKTEAGEGRLSIFGTDLTIEMGSTLEVDVREEGQMCLPVKHFLPLLRTMSGGRVRIKQDGNRAFLKGDSGMVCRLNLVDVSMFPPLASPPTTRRAYPMKEFRQMVDKTGFLFDTEMGGKFIMDGAKLEENQEGFLMVSTDSRRMSVYRAALEGGAEFSVFIPSRALPVVAQLKGEVVWLGEEGNKIYFIAGDDYVAVTKLSGSFPSWGPVMQIEKKHAATVAAPAFLAALKTAAVVCDEHTREVKFTFSEAGLVLSSKSAEVGESSETIPVEYESDEASVEMLFNVDMLLDFVAPIEGDIEIIMAGPNAGALFKSGAWSYVVMPIIR